MGKTYTLKQQAVLVFIGKGSGYLINIAIPIILVRLFTQEQFGFYRQYLLIAGTIVPILGFQLYNSLFYFYPLSKTKQEQMELMSQTFFIILAIGIIFVAGFLLLKNPVLGFIGNSSISDIYTWAGLYTGFTLMGFGLQNLFIIEGKANLAMLYSIGAQLIRVCLLFTAIILFGTVRAAVISLALYETINTVLLFCYLFCLYRISVFKISLNNIYRQFKYALPMAMSQFVGTIGQQADKLILIALFTAGDFAVYAVGNFRIPMLTMLYDSVGNVILRQISRYSTSRDNNRKTLVLWKKMIVKNATLTIPTVVLCFVMAHPIITLLFGDQYVAGVKIFRIFLLVLLVQMLGYGYIVRGYAKITIIFLANLAKMIFTVSVGYLLIKHFGIIGAAVTFLLGFVINAAIQLFRSKQILEVSWSEFLPWKDFALIASLSALPALGPFLLCRMDLSKVVHIAGSLLFYLPAAYLLMMAFKYVPKPIPANIRLYFGMTQ